MKTIPVLHPDVRYAKLWAKFIELCDDDKEYAAAFMAALHRAVQDAQADGDVPLHFLRG